MLGRAIAIPALPRLVCAVSLALGAAVATRGFDGESTHHAIVEYLAGRGLTAEPGDVRSVGPEGGSLATALGFRPFLALAGPPGGGRDLFYLEARVTPGGHLLQARRLTNLTRSPAADETDLAVDGWSAAFATRTEAGHEAVTLLDVSGEPRALTNGWGLFWRAAVSVTRFQETGRLAGIGRTRYVLLKPSREITLSLDRGGLTVETDDGRIRVPRPGTRPTEGEGLASVQPSTRGQPGLLGWAVDTVRNHPWVGPEPVERLEHVFFRAQDLGRRAYWSLRGEETADEIEREMGLGAPDSARLEAPPPEIGFPPPPTRTVLSTRLEGEGEWVPVRDYLFTRDQPGLGPVFYSTYLRADPERSYARAFLTVWDPRQVALGLRAGTHEPVGDTGLAGDGMIPRDRKLLRRLVAGFNGGFQALHGEYGVMIEGEVLLPGKPWSATVAMLSGGRLGFGTWPPDLDSPPPGFVSFRQNMTVLVEDGTVDPYRRPWWGGAPPGAEDPAHTIRTAVCLTEEGFGLYAWGKSLSHETLAAALIAARCSYAIHLDMNVGHSGFEFYRVDEASEAPPLERRLERNLEAEGEVRDIEGLVFRSRRMVRGMGHMRFPRYIARDPRDFFYLTLRPILPGEPLPLGRAPREDGEGVFSVAGLPHAGFPYAVARASVRPLAARPDARVHVLRVDPQRISFREEDGAVPLGALYPGTGTGPLAVVARPADVGPILSVVPADAPGVDASQTVLRGTPLEGSDARAAAGVDPDGRLVWAEGPDSEALAAALALAGVENPLALAGSEAHFEFRHGEQVARLDGGLLVEATGPTIGLYGVDRPVAMRLFPDVQVVPPRVWFPLQAKRVRYFRERDAGAGGADGGAPPRATSGPDAGP